ncbi:MAG: hypothetical protein FWC32_02085 [Firmicutes bacterium]|nr:hypothetical protein [Bacillota bacterium]
MMVFGFVMALVVLLVFLGICAGIIILQVYLCKKESRWPGLIMPLLTFGFSLLILFSMAVFSFSGNYHIHVQQVFDIDAGSAVLHLDERDAVVNHLIDYGQIGQTRITSAPRIMFVMFMVNIPTLILLAIYAGCRTGHRRQRALDLMSLQDLG